MNANCDCCTGPEALTPSLANRPGLNALSYRLGTHGTFFDALVARLASSDLPALAGLKTRDRHDPAIALLDAWATVADVLTFYQERIANEGYLRTATERRSVLELARLVGYKLRPGVAASVYLAFTLEQGFNEQAKVPGGTRSQSLPAPGEMPQAFETEQDTEARTDWNQLLPRLRRPQFITLGNAAEKPEMYFASTDANLKTNDPLLLVFGQNNGEQVQVVRQIQAIKVSPDKQRTQVSLLPLMAALPDTPAEQGEILEVRSAAALSANVAPPMRLAGPQFSNRDLLSGNTLAAANLLPSLAAVKALSLPPSLPPANAQQLTRTPSQAFAPTIDIATQLLVNLNPALRPALYQAWSNTKILAHQGLDTVDTIEKFGVKASPFGHNAPLKPDYSDGVPVDFSEWDLAEKPITLEMRLEMSSGTNPSQTIFNLTQNNRTIRAVDGLTLGTHHIPLLEDDQEIESVRVSVFTLQTAWIKFSHRVPNVGPVDVYLNQPLRQQGPTKLLSGLFPNQDSDYLALPLATEVRTSSEFSTRVSNATIDTQAIPHLFVIPAGQSIDGEMNRLLDVSLADLQPNLAPNEAYKLTFQQTNALSLVVSPTDINSLRQENEISRITATFLREQREYRIIVISGGTIVEIENGSLFSTRLQNRPIEDFSENRRIRISNTTDPISISIQEEAFSKGVSRVVALDGEYDKITPNSWVVIARPDREQPIVAQVKQVKTVSKAEYGITGKVSQLTLDRPWLFLGDRSLALLRETTIYAQSEPLEIADEVIDPLAHPIGGEDREAGGPFEIELDRLYDGLKPGRWLIVSGERADIPGAEGVRASELVMLAGVRQGVAQVVIPTDVAFARDGASDQSQLINLPGDVPHSFLQLAQPLAYRYRRDTVTVYGNVVKATHGETRREVLGSGDGSQALQQFALSKSPLTYLSAPTREGVESTLEVRVDDVKWQEVENLAAASNTDHSYITRTDNDNKTTVVFGDGVQGARLPSGSENVMAVYRDGIGQVGNVKAEQIKLLATRPLGVKGVINPLPASGGADRETVLQAKRNAPMAVMALDRLVSVQDYADFVRTFAGIAKADAQTISNGRRELIHLTIAGANNSPIETSSDLYRNLWRSLRRFGDPYQSLQIDQRELMIVLMSARVRILPQYLWEKVKEAIEAALFEQFSFERRDLGQDLLLSEVITTIHQVPGVDYVDVNILDSVSETEAEDPETLSQKLLQLAEPALVEGDGETPMNPQPRPRIPVHLAQGGGGDGLPLRPAQLAILSPNLPETLKLEEITL